jgi:hypothetical protein
LYKRQDEFAKYIVHSAVKNKEQNISKTGNKIHQKRRMDIDNSQSLGGKLSYYHDRYGLEADAVLHLEDGRYALIEFKLGSREIEEGAKHLLEIKRLVKEYNLKEKQCPLREPDLLLVITGGNMAYTREDSVKVIPIGCLKD